MGAGMIAFGEVRPRVRKVGYEIANGPSVHAGWMEESDDQQAKQKKVKKALWEKRGKRYAKAALYVLLLFESVVFYWRITVFLSRNRACRSWEWSATTTRTRQSYCKWLEAWLKSNAAHIRVRNEKECGRWLNL